MAEPVSSSDVRAALARILASSGFAAAGRLGPFLSYLAEQALAGIPVKESIVGVDVFERRPGYDPRIDPIVRVEARRLRARLAEYYEKEGAAETVRVELPKGTYVPVFSRLPAAAPADPAAAVPRTPPGWKRTGLIAALAAAVLVAAGAFYLVRRQPPAPPSVAVLPFVNVSAEVENEYFSDGLTEELIDGLSRVEGLRVAARSSVFQFKGRPVDVREAGRRLNVRAVVEGSVRKSGDRLRITAQLVNVADGYQMWSQTYERELRDVFAIQEEIARAIVNGLKVPLRAGGRQTLAPRYTERVEAFNLFLQGRYQWNQYTLAGVLRALDYFERALAVDPAYAPAYAALSGCYSILGYYREVPEREPWLRAGEAARKALALDATLAEAHASLGFALAWREWDWAGARDAFRRALELDPASPEVLTSYAVAYLIPQGRLEEANAVLRRAVDRDPVMALARLGSAYSLLVSRRFEEAVEQYLRVAELMPNRSDTWWDLGMAHAFAGHRDRALAAFRRASELRGEGQDWKPGSKELALLGDIEGARRVVAAYGHAAYEKNRAIQSVYTYALTGDKDRAFRQLDRALAERDPELIWLKVDLRVANLRGDPRLETILERVGLK